MKTYNQFITETKEVAAKQAFSKIHSASKMKPDEESHKKATPSSQVKHSLTYHAKDGDDAKKKMAHLHDSISKVHQHTKTEQTTHSGTVHHYKSSVNGKRITMSHVRAGAEDDVKHHVIVTHNY